MPQVTRTWSVPTSPRNPYKLANELKLLSEFEGKEWSRETQFEFAKRLPSIDSFEGEVSAQYSDFSARDRINRAPKTFGFVRFDDRNRIKITDAGKQLIEGRRLEELFLRQLLKWQYPSAKHDDDNYIENFCIKPFLEVLRISYLLEGITKYEVALFCVPLIKFTDTERVIDEIREFRSVLSNQTSAVDKKRFIRDAFYQRFGLIYRDDISSGNIRIREGRSNGTVESFLKTKIRNTKDYADAAIRYFRATGLFTISTNTYRLVIKEEKKEIVKNIIDTFKRDAEPFIKNPAGFLDYLGSIQEPFIPQDNKVIVLREIELIQREFIQKNIVIELEPQKKLDNKDSLDLESLKDLRDALTDNLLRESVKKERDSLKDYRILDDIKSVFEKIHDRYNDEIPDKPLFFEWNVWRSLCLLDDGEIKGNLRIDTNGSPLNMALGNMADIECYYDDFVLIVEVTLAMGQRQYETEGEPVPRHVGQAIKRLRDNGDVRPVYGLFIAANLNSSALAHFYVLRKTEVQYYGGKVKIIPLSSQDLINMLVCASVAGGVKALNIHSFLKWADEEAEKSDNEQDWYSKINSRVNVWSEMPSKVEGKSDLFFRDVISDGEVREQDKYVEYLPVYSLEAVATSFGKEEQVQRLGWKKVLVRKLNRDMFIAQVVGKSMEPTIPDGSYCIFRFERGGSRNGLAVLVESRLVADSETNQKFTVKRYKSEKEDLGDGQWRHKKIILSPDNKEFKDIVLENVAGDDFRVVAEFVEVL